MTCSHCGNTSHNRSGCSSYQLHRIDNILNNGIDVAHNTTNQRKWFKDHKNRTPNDENYKLTKKIIITKGTNNSPEIEIKLNLNQYDISSRLNLNVLYLIRNAVLLKKHSNHPALDNKYISCSSFHTCNCKIQYINNKFIVEQLNEEEEENCYKNAKDSLNKFNSFIKTNKHITDAPRTCSLYKDILTKHKRVKKLELDYLYRQKNGIDDSEIQLQNNINVKREDFYNFIKENCKENPFIETNGGIFPEIEQERERIYEENIRIEREQREERTRLREEARHASQRRREELREAQRARINIQQREAQRIIEEKKANMILKTDIVETEDCPICMDELGNTNKAILRCGHQFCSDCIFTHLQKARGSDCPCCRAEYAIRPLGWLPPREQN